MSLELMCRKAKECKLFVGKMDTDEKNKVLVDAANLLIEKAEVKKIRVHDLRHSHVAYLIHQGVDPLVIKERLGHKDIKITLNTYGHLYPSKQRSLAQMLDRER